MLYCAWNGVFEFLYRWVGPLVLRVRTALTRGRVLSDLPGIFSAHRIRVEFIAYSFDGVRGSLVRYSTWSRKRHCLDRRWRRWCPVPTSDPRSTTTSWLGLVHPYHSLHPAFSLHHQYPSLPQQNPSPNTQSCHFPVASHPPGLPHLPRRHRSHGLHDSRRPLR